jgi:molybdopterin synthase sulfur carrier subunit
MHITAKLFATLRKYRPELSLGDALRLEVAAGSTLGEVVSQLGIPYGVPLVAMVNNTVRDQDYVLSEGDRLALFPPVAGG